MNKAEHSGLKLMDTEGLDPQKLHGAPPLMPWPKFAEWIGMGDEPEKEGVWDYPYFMAMSFISDGRTPSEIPFMDILTIRVMRYRDRHGSGNVLPQ